MKSTINAIGISVVLSLVPILTFAAPNPEPAADAVDDNATLTVPAADSEKKRESDFSAGMRIPVDGSSLEAFDKSLEDIKKETTEAEYTTLINALDYLLVYDLAAKRNRAKLAERLNGLTGEEIVGKVSW